MKQFLVLLSLISIYSIAQSQERDISERYVQAVEKASAKKAVAKPYINAAQKMMAGGGEILTTDCYSFVPVPANAIALDPNDADSGNSLDGAWGPFPLDFNFCHFGDSYSQFYINMKGNITFDNFNTTFVPAGFPSNDFAMIAGYWADIDLRCETCGQVYYWTTATAAYITFVDVGYYNNHGDLNNTFQIVITDQTDEVVGEGNNVGLFYEDMQWAAGDWNGGQGGFGGTAAGTVGANKNDGQNFIQFGRFITNDDNYDGPFGGDDGIHWLDDKAFVFNICSTQDNLPPIANNADACDTLYICQNDTYDFDVSFIGPEAAQTITVTVDDSEADGWVMEDSGDGFMTGTFTGGPDNVGEHTLVFTGTDSGTPAGVTAVVYNIVVLDLTLPDLTVDGVGFDNDIISYCGGQPGADLTASDGFDNYVWSNNTNGQTTTLAEGEHILVGILEGCEAEYGPISVFQTPAYNPDVVVDDLFVCSGETTEIAVDEPELYTSIEWSVYNNDGDILSPDLNAESITVTDGFYLLTVEDESGCEGSRIVPVTEEVVNVPQTTFAPDCGDKSFSWSGAWADPESCPNFIYLYDSEGDTWEGANVEVFIDGTGPFNFNISNGAAVVNTGTPAFHGQTIEYYFTSGADDDDINVSIFNCDNQIIFDSTQPGDDLTEGLFFTQVVNAGFNALTGTWTQTPDIGTFSDPTEFNPVNGAQTFTVPNDFIGTVTIGFEADVCDLDIEFDLIFSETPTVSIPVSPLVGCSDEDIEIVPEYGPAELSDTFEYDWSPGALGSDATAEVSSSVNYTIEVENSCGSSEASGEVIITATPEASLNNYTLCDNESQTLNPGPTDDSFVYVWSTGATSPTINVTESDDYSVTITNECGEASATSTVTTAFSPTVSGWGSNVDTLICPGDEILIDPTWNQGNNLVVWNMTWVDTLGQTQSATLTEMGEALSFGSDQIPQDAFENEVQISYQTVNGCGSASGSISAYTSPCFLEATNVFSPDTDGGEGTFTGGLNEGWYIVGIENLNNVHVRIFDRWGALVYENENYRNAQPWRGEHTNGIELSEGVYFYTVNTPRTEGALQGSVTLLRK